MKLLYVSVFLSVSSYAMATTPVVGPEGTSVTRALSSDSNADVSSSSSFEACNVHFTDYKSPALTDEEYYEKKTPISQWSCLYSGEAFEAGYDAQQVNNKGIDVSSADNKIIYDYKNKSWKSIPDKTYVRNGKNNHLTLVQVKSKNATGFMAVNSMAKLKGGTMGKSVYFCLIHNNNALCGSGDSSFDDKGGDLSKNTLKLLESISFDDN
ncbi:hypothetical protein [Lonsdalea quercina]|uniref:hypothetical protein n=1 Tax=Lonsdalea quercina TaxID=71657 RepID=UPI0039748221